MLKYLPPVLAALLLLAAPARSDDSVPFAHPDRIRFDSHCFTIDGKDMFIYSGSFHYFRCPKALWPARFQAIKDAGFNTVETYTAWNWHEQEMPDSLTDFSKFKDLQDIDDWLTMAEKYGLYVIVRPGPYICAEWDNGGFPRWMSTLKKPATPLRKEGWLRSDDPVYLAWCKHWYDAVCPIIARHQITRKAPGQPGVILFQIENEYDFWKMPNAARLNYLTALANDARADGIDVPLLTCWTKVIRGIKSGPLKGVFDCTNFYPRLRIEHDVKPEVTKLRAQQPDALLATTELQGGWFAEVGGKLSYEQPGLSPAEIQNLTLYVWQLGDTMTNYYMLFGGTNFDDWAGGKNITSYDYDAPIREDGNVGDRYQRVQMLGAMIREHGAKLARADAVEITGSATDKDVELAERKAQDGSRYLFVRTENANAPRNGSATVKEKDGTTLSFDYKLEPFGAMVLYLPAGVTDAKQGEWLPKPVLPVEHLEVTPQPVAIGNAQMASADLPAKWQKLAPGAPVDSLGIYGSHFFYYKIAAKPGAKVTIQIPNGDAIIAACNGKSLIGTSDKPAPHVATVNIAFTLPPDGRDLLVLYENPGHPNFGPAMEQPFGIVSVQGADSDTPMQIATGPGDISEKQAGVTMSIPSMNSSPIPSFKSVSIAKDAAPAPDAMLTWYLMNFELPQQGPGATAPWHLHLEANGNGFIYVNGHCIGRYWQVGPQHDFYVPDCWLNFGPGKVNGVALDLRPVNKGVALQAAYVVPNPTFAVETPLPAQ
jgi:hypothetical protein